MLITESNYKNFGLSNFEYKPFFIFKNHHINTMFPYCFRKLPNPNYVRKRFDTDDGDFIDIDFVIKNSKQIVVLLHGLEGSSYSQYILGMVDKLSSLNIDICALNHRSCSGEMNRTTTFYHSGFTQDLTFIINQLSEKYHDIFVAGYSLGGNMLLKYLGTHINIPKQLKAAIAFSVPCHLSSSAVMLNHWKNKAYAVKFLQTLNRKIIEKARSIPHLLNVNDYKNAKTLYEYDNMVTAPLHGFKDAEDYYSQSSSKQFLHQIKVPSILINAQDDSFLAPECFPVDEAKHHDYFHFLSSKYGGHVGFASLDHRSYWSDQKAIEWFIHNGMIPS